MSITINMQHTFTTRAVFSKEIIEGIRGMFKQSHAELINPALAVGIPEDQLKVHIRRTEEAIAMSDDALCEFMVKEAYKNTMKEELKSFFEELQVTRVSPVQSTRVKKVSKKVSEGTLKSAATCGLHGEDKPCTALCKRFTVTK